MTTACGNEDKEAVQTQNPEQNVEKVETETKEPVEPNTNLESESKAETADFQRVIPSDWDIKLPTDFPVTKGKYVTAITSSKQNKVTFTFYNTDKQLAMNDPKIKKMGQLVGQLVLTKYATEKAASEEIDKTVFTDGKAVDLGHNITGYQDAGAGSLFTSWNEGRWAIIARSTTEKPEESLATAKETVEFLETNMIPIPKQYGQLHMDANQDRKSTRLNSSHWE